MDSSRLDLNLLLTLEALLAEQNVTRAAARLHLSQPAVSAQLGRLRSLFQDPLLLPGHRGMTPTARGAELFVPLRKALDQVRATLDEQGEFVPAASAMTVTIACTDYLLSAVVNRLVVILRTEAPGIRVALRSLDLAQLDVQMASGDVDLALMSPEVAPPSLRTRHLFDERYLLIGRRDHPGLAGTLTLERFLALEHVVVSLQGGNFFTPVDEALAASGQRRKVVLSASSFLFVPQVVRQSDLVAIVPSRLVQDCPEGLQVLRCPLPVEGFSVGMVWHERSQTHGGHRWIRERVASVADSA